MSDTTIHQSVASPKAVTMQYDFLNATPDGEKLFSVRGGVPLRDAFDQLSLLLSQSKSVVEDVCTVVSAGDEPCAHWAASQLLEFTYALVQSMHNGLIEHEKATAQR
jgi:hypothetical protein